MPLSAKALRLLVLLRVLCALLSRDNAALYIVVAKLYTLLLILKALNI